MEALLLRQGIRVNQSQIVKIRVNHRVNQRFGGYFFALFPEKGGKRYGEDHDERAGISNPDGYQPSKGIQAGKDSGFPVIHVGSRILIPVEAYKEWLLRTSAQQ